MIGSFAPLSLMECCASETASFLALLEKHLTENPVTGTCEEIDPSITTVTVTNKVVAIH
jgi:hypothetical protein